MDSLHMWLVVNGIALLNAIFDLIELVYVNANVAVKAIQDSSVSNILIFRNRNESPWLIKENALPVLKGAHLSYSMKDKKFYELSTISDISSILKMDDIIMAELVDSTGTTLCDMSDLLHSVKWNYAFPPSVYELILVQIFISNMCLSKEYLAKCVLNVTTLANPCLSIKVGNPLLKDDFISWNIFNILPVVKAPAHEESLLEESLPDTLSSDIGSFPMEPSASASASASASSSEVLL